MARSGTRRSLRGVVALVVVAVVIVAGAVLVRTLWRNLTDHLNAGCDFGGTTHLSTSQAAVASSMVGVAIRRELPERAALLTIMAGLQESKLVNIPAGQGDRDSVGVLQQRPSQGWGTAAQLSDVRYATGKFLTALAKVPSWQTLAPSTAIQKVQISADGTAYAKHQDDASAIVKAFWTDAHTLRCQFTKPTVAATPATVSSQLRRDLPVTTPRVEARAVRVPGASGRTAAWLVANADRLGIASVSFSGQTWSRTKDWHGDKHAAAGEVSAELADV